MWFTETPWPPILAISVLAALLIAAAYSKQRSIYLLGVAALVLISGAIYVVERLIVTESEKVEASVYGITSAFQRADLEGTLEFFSPEDSEDRALVETALNMVTVEDDLRITDVQITMSAEETLAVSHFRANATVHAKGYGNISRHPSRWELTWRREQGEWRVVRVQRLHPLSGDPIGFLSSGQ